MDSIVSLRFHECVLVPLALVSIYARKCSQLQIDGFRSDASWRSEVETRRADQRSLLAGFPVAVTRRVRPSSTSAPPPPRTSSTLVGSQWPQDVRMYVSGMDARSLEPTYARPAHCRQSLVASATLIALRGSRQLLIAKAADFAQNAQGRTTGGPSASCAAVGAGGPAAG